MATWCVRFSITVDGKYCFYIYYTIFSKTSIFCLKMSKLDIWFSEQLLCLLEYDGAGFLFRNLHKGTQIHVQYLELYQLLIDLSN